MRPQVLHEVNTTGHTYNYYYEPLDDKETDNDVDESNHDAFTVTETTRSPSITFSSTIQIQTFDPKCTTLQDSPDSCEGVLILDTRDSPKSPGSPHHESLGTQHIAVASANGIAAHLSSF
jgi:hypothetical protein